MVVGCDRLALVQRADMDVAAAGLRLGDQMPVHPLHALVVLGRRNVSRCGGGGANPQGQEANAFLPGRLGETVTGAGQLAAHLGEAGADAGGGFGHRREQFAVQGAAVARGGQLRGVGQNGVGVRDRLAGVLVDELELLFDPQRQREATRRGVGGRQSRVARHPTVPLPLCS